MILWMMVSGELMELIAAYFGRHGAVRGEAVRCCCTRLVHVCMPRGVHKGDEYCDCVICIWARQVGGGKLETIVW